MNWMTSTGETVTGFYMKGKHCKHNTQPANIDLWM